MESDLIDAHQSFGDEGVREYSIVREASSGAGTFLQILRATWRSVKKLLSVSAPGTQRSGVSGGSRNRTRSNTDTTDFHGSDKKEIRVNLSHPCLSVFYLGRQPLTPLRCVRGSGLSAGASGDRPAPRTSGGSARGRRPSASPGSETPATSTRTAERGQDRSGP